MHFHFRPDSGQHLFEGFHWKATCVNQLIVQASLPLSHIWPRDKEASSLKLPTLLLPFAQHQTPFTPPCPPALPPASLSLFLSCLVIELPLAALFHQDFPSSSKLITFPTELISPFLGEIRDLWCFTLCLQLCSGHFCTFSTDKLNLSLAFCSF